MPAREPFDFQIAIRSGNPVYSSPPFTPDSMTVSRPRCLFALLPGLVLALAGMGKAQSLPKVSGQVLAALGTSSAQQRIGAV